MHSTIRFLKREIRKQPSILVSLDVPHRRILMRFVRRLQHQVLSVFLRMA